MIGRLIALGAAAAAGIAATAAAIRSQRKPDKRASESEGAVAAPGRSKPPATTTAPAAETDERDDLTALKGIGAVSAERLGAIGVTSFTQVAAWSDQDIEDIGTRIKISPERIRREDWVGQARTTLEG